MPGCHSQSNHNHLISDFFIYKSFPCKSKQPHGTRTQLPGTVAAPASALPKDISPLGGGGGRGGAPVTPPVSRLELIKRSLKNVNTLELEQLQMSRLANAQRRRTQGVANGLDGNNNNNNNNSQRWVIW